MRSFIVNYTHPLRYRGTYLTTAIDGIEAGKKVRDYLQDKYGYEPDQRSSVHEIEDNRIQVLA